MLVIENRVFRDDAEAGEIFRGSGGHLGEVRQPPADRILDRSGMGMEAEKRCRAEGRRQRWLDGEVRKNPGIDLQLADSIDDKPTMGRKMPLLTQQRCITIDEDHETPVEIRESVVWLGNKAGESL